MDNFDISNFGNQNPNEPAPAKDESDHIVPFDDTDDTDVSHTPFKLGDSPAKTPSGKKPSGKIVSTDRITGVKVFFTKLHAGAIDFIIEQINGWLKDNPDVVVKRANTTTGMVVAKKTEPNLIITVWY